MKKSLLALALLSTVLAAPLASAGPNTPVKPDPYAVDGDLTQPTFAYDRLMKAEKEKQVKATKVSAKAGQKAKADYEPFLPYPANFHIDP